MDCTRMIFQTAHVYDDLERFRDFLGEERIRTSAASARSVLVQVYCATLDGAEYEGVRAAILDACPRAVIVGATTVGEIVDGQSLTGRTVVGLTFFENSSLAAHALSCERGGEAETGHALARAIAAYPAPVSGVLLLATPLSIDASALLQGMEQAGLSCPVFGGGAGDYAAMQSSRVFHDDRFIDSGAVVVVLAGDDLHLSVETYLGWRALSRPMRITGLDGLVVTEVDGKPAADIYKRYLGLRDGDNFFLNALEFPFLMERESGLIARVPIAVTEGGGLQFVADIRQGEAFRLGYGNPALIAENAGHVHGALTAFGSQAVFLYSCGCRRFLMQQDVNLEVSPFSKVAPTVGFYTYGEFFGVTRLDLLNSTMVAVGLREGERWTGSGPEVSAAARTAPGSVALDPYANKHARIVSRLVHFIDAVTSELEESHREVLRLSMTDKLTGLPNRSKLDLIIEAELEKALQGHRPLSLILIDVDFFKSVNDDHGHLAGDAVLAHIGRALSSELDANAVIGRWGGEEFLIILPERTAAEARVLAEHLRQRIAGENFPVAGSRTISLGVAAFEKGEDAVSALARADSALYLAKARGRNRVETCQDEAAATSGPR